MKTRTRLLALFLCLVTLLALVLTSCSEKTDKETEEDIRDGASQEALTLTMWIVSDGDNKISDADAARISNKINSITNSKFKTQLVIRYLTEAEYYTELEKNITAYANNPNRGQQATQKPTEKVTGETSTNEVITDETVTNADGMSFIKYPDVLENQVDIIYVGNVDIDNDGVIDITGEQKYVEYIEKGWLTELDTELSSSSKKIKEYVSATLLSAAKYNGTTYAVPNNRPIGEYTYMLLNKELMQACAWDANIKTNMIDGLFSENLYPFLTLIDLMNENNEILPIDATYEECLNLLAHYWNIESEGYTLSDLQKFSLFGHHYTNIEDLSRGSIALGYESLFANEDFVEAYLKLNEFRFRDYLRTEGETRTQAAIKFLEGDSTILETLDADGVPCYTDETGSYYPVVVKYPSASSEDIYGNMFGVCTYTRKISRSMQIVTYLNTNSDFRNLLQYGIEGEDYKITRDKDGKFVSFEPMTNSAYKMDIYATGNTFIAHPNKDMDANVWESGKVQNRNSLVNPLLGFDFAEFAATTGTAPEPMAADSKKGYSISYTTGYSKDVLSQNATIKAWLEACDAKPEKGIYLLRSFAVSGQTTNAVYYIYNNRGNANLTVAENKLTTTNEDGKEVDAGYDIVLTYAPETTGDGYELSVMKMVSKKTAVFNLKAAEPADGEAVTELAINEIQDRQAGEGESPIDFDFFNTQKYSIEIYNNLSQSAVLKNNALITWLKNKDSTNSKSTTDLLTFKEGNVYTFVFYRSALKNENEITVQPLGTSDNLILNVAINEFSDIKLKDDSDPNYKLCYVRVTTTGDDVKVNYSHSHNGRTMPIPEANITTDINPDFEIVGNLDTELVKFLEKLNTVMIGELDACYAECKAKVDAGTMTVDQAVAAYTALVKDIGKLLDPSVKNAYAYTVENYPVLSADAQPDTDTIEPVFVLETRLGVSAETLLQYVKSITSHNIVKVLDSTGNPALYDGVEEYVYFDSPYGIYYAWLEKFGFLPETKK